jgi:hypothetical protein
VREHRAPHVLAETRAVRDRALQRAPALADEVVAHVARALGGAGLERAARRFDGAQRERPPAPRPSAWRAPPPPAGSGRGSGSPSARTRRRGSRCSTCSTRLTRST